MHIDAFFFVSPFCDATTITNFKCKKKTHRIRIDSDTYSYDDGGECNLLQRIHFTLKLSREKKQERERGSLISSLV